MRLQERLKAQIQRNEELEKALQDVGETTTIHSHDKALLQTRLWKANRISREALERWPHLPE